MQSYCGDKASIYVFGRDLSQSKYLFYAIKRQKIYFRLIKDLNAKDTTLKLTESEHNIGSNHFQALDISSTGEQSLREWK